MGKPISAARAESTSSRTCTSTGAVPRTRSSAKRSGRAAWSDVTLREPVGVCVLIAVFPHASAGLSSLPAGDHGREVPGRDQHTDADRLAKRHVQTRRHDRNRFAEEFVRGTAPVLVHVRDEVELSAQGGADGLPHVPRLEAGEVFLTLADQEGCPRQDAAARACRHAWPRALLERARSGDSDGPSRVLGARFGDLPSRLAGRPGSTTFVVAPSAAPTRSPPSISSSVIVRSLRSPASRYRIRPRPVARGTLGLPDRTVGWRGSAAQGCPRRGPMPSPREGACVSKARSHYHGRRQRYGQGRL